MATIRTHKGLCIQRLKLSGAENTGSETGVIILSINRIHNFCYIPKLHDITCKNQRIYEIIRGRYHSDSLNLHIHIERPAQGSYNTL